MKSNLINFKISLNFCDIDERFNRLIKCMKTFKIDIYLFDVYKPRH